MTKEDKINKIYEVIGGKSFMLTTGESLEYLMIGDCIDWIDKNVEFKAYRIEVPLFEMIGEMCMVRKELRKPIESQPESCIAFIYGLIEDGETTK